MVYDTQTLTITDDSAEFSLTSVEPKVGQTVVLESTDPCPSGTESVDGFLYDLNMSTASYETTVNTSGHWETELVIPSDFPVGEVGITAVCRPPAPHGGTRTQSYADVEAFVSPPTPYVALGDSYSSGTGTFNYYPESGNCYRSGYSYPLYVADQLNLGVPLFAACHGAQTADFYNQNPNTGEPAQISHLSEDTEVVTLTIGGNDAGFGEVLDECVHRAGHQGFGCSSDSSLVTALSERFDALEGTIVANAPDDRTIVPLLQLYEGINILAPNAEIYVGGYPQLFGSSIADYEPDSNAPGSAYCPVTLGATVSYDDAQWLNQMADELNGIIADAVEAAQNEGIDITFVPAALFSGYGLCDTYSPWINEVVMDGNFPVPNLEPESMHPTSAGYQNGYGIAFVTMMN